MRMVAATLGPDDVVLALSATGKTPELLDAARIARQYHARVVAVTRVRIRQWPRAADVSLTLDVPEVADVLKPTASRFAYLVAIDLLATGVAYQLGPEAQENLRRVKYNLMNIREGEILEPLGD